MICSFFKRIYLSFPVPFAKYQRNVSTLQRIIGIPELGCSAGTPDKGATSHDDLFDAFRMSLQFYQ
jgi:hypothetical protein